MPNWCENNLKIGHKEKSRIDTIHKIVTKLLDTPSEKLKEEDGLMHSFIPRPSKEVLGDNGWYNWEIKNWGCKWDIFEQWYHQPEVVFVEDKQLWGIELGFNSAWSPPVAFYETLEERGFYIYATFNEGGCDFVGRYTEGTDTTYSFDDVPKEDKELSDYVKSWRSGE